MGLALFAAFLLVAFALFGAAFLAGFAADFLLVAFALFGAALALALFGAAFLLVAFALFGAALALALFGAAFLTVFLLVAVFLVAIKKIPPVNCSPIAGSI
ncbi:MAG: hypothetical protein ACRDDW_04975 [Candidatus Rhabdochlamydia sp.]